MTYCFIGNNDIWYLLRISTKRTGSTLYEKVHCAAQPFSYKAKQIFKVKNNSYKIYVVIIAIMIYYYGEVIDCFYIWKMSINVYTSYKQFIKNQLKFQKRILLGGVCKIDMMKIDVQSIMLILIYFFLEKMFAQSFGCINY